MEIVGEMVLLEDLTAKDHTKRRVHGDVARMSDGRFVARRKVTLSDGSSAFAVRDWAPGEDVRVARTWDNPTDWGATLFAWQNATPGGYVALGPDLDLVELDRFREQWPSVSAQLGLDVTRLGRFTLFDCGPVLIPKGAGPQLPLRGSTAGTWPCPPRVMIDWTSLVADHAAGVFGEFGEHDTTPLADEEIFTLPRRPVAIQNRYAISTKTAAVRSRFALGDVQQKEFPREGPWQTWRVVADVTTHFAPGRTRTLCTLQQT